MEDGGPMDFRYFAAGPESFTFGNAGLPPLAAGSGSAQASHADDVGLVSSGDFGPFSAYNGGPFDTPNILELNDSFGGQTNGHLSSSGGDGSNGRLTGDGEVDLQQNGRESSEDKDTENLTPAQSRRKEQNRTAQRAFRERKERHVKDLERQLKTAQSNTDSLVSEVDRLKADIARLSTENAVLKATAPLQHPHALAQQPPLAVGKMSYSPTQFYAKMLSGHADQSPSRRIVVSEVTGERLLGAGAAWDVIVKHPKFAQGGVSIGDLCDQLVAKAKCDGQGPVFLEGDIIRAIEESVSLGSDELI